MSPPSQLHLNTECEPQTSMKGEFSRIKVVRLAFQEDWTGVDVNTLQPSNLLFYCVCSKGVSYKRDDKAPRITRVLDTTRMKKSVLVSEVVTKMICSPSDKDHDFSVVIDGVVWMGVHYVAISSQWVSAVKTFPLVSMK